jgi:hypothetical protein
MATASVRESAMRDLYRATSAEEVAKAAAILGQQDIDATMRRLDSDGFCATWQDVANNDSPTEGGAIVGEKKRQSHAYAISVYKRYCDRNHNYYEDMQQLMGAVKAVRSKSKDYQAVQDAQALTPAQRAQVAPALYDIMTQTDSPATFAQIAGLLLNSNNAYDFGNNLVEGTGWENRLSEIDRVAVNLAYCQLIGNCNQVGSIDALTICSQDAMCQPGMTYWSVLQATTAPQEFEIAQQIAQRLLQSRQGR